MLSLIPEQGTPVQPTAQQSAPDPSAIPAPKKPPLALWIVIGVAGVSLACCCIVVGSVAIFRTGGSGIVGPTEVTETIGDDAIVAEGTERIAAACADYAGYYGTGPSVDDVWPYGAVAQFMDEWPTNPYSGDPMMQSDEPGDFTFATAISMGDGREYLGYVYGHLSDGTDYAAAYEY